MTWRLAEAEALDEKADELAITIDRLEGNYAFLERDLNGKSGPILVALGLLRSCRNDYRSDAEQLRAQA